MLKRCFYYKKIKSTVVRKNGGGEIRTHETFSCLHAFQACSIGHSDTPPEKRSILDDGSIYKQVKACRRFAQATLFVLTFGIQQT